MKDDRFDRGSQEAFPEQKRLRDAWERLTPGEEAKERMLAHILEEKRAPASPARTFQAASRRRNAWVLALGCLLLFFCLSPLFRMISPLPDQLQGETGAAAQDTNTGRASEESFPACEEAPCDSKAELILEAAPQQEAEELVLKDSSGLYACYEENPEAFFPFDFSASEDSLAPESKTAADSGAAKSDLTVLGEVSSIRFLQIFREDGSLFTRSAVVTLQVLSRLTGETPSDTLTLTLPEAVLKGLSSGPWELPEEGRKGIFTLTPAGGKTLETDGAVLYWSDLGEFLLEEKDLELLILQGTDRLLYQEDSFQKLSPKMTLEEAAQVVVSH